VGWLKRCKNDNAAGPGKESTTGLAAFPKGSITLQKVLVLGFLV
jgi:hypothetical protein